MIFHFNPTDAFEIGGPKVGSHILHSDLGLGVKGKKETEENGKKTERLWERREREGGRGGKRERDMQLVATIILFFV